MSNELTRRDFLKLSSVTLSSLPFVWRTGPKLQSGADQKNVLVLVFDTWSAKNISLYGYDRRTTPNLARLAENATVYHNHFAGGHETRAGATTLVHGAYTWSTWKFGINENIRPPYDQANLFGLFEDYHRIAYTHNPVAETVLLPLTGLMDEYQERQSLFLNKNLWLTKYFGDDFDIAGLSWVRVGKSFDDGFANSLFLSKVYEKYQKKVLEGYKEDFPLGPPVIQEDNYFLLEEAIDWIQDQVATLPRPFLGYFHLLPPHAQYRPRREFLRKFRGDDYLPNLKTVHPLSNRPNGSNLISSRRFYDEYILYVDSEIGRLFDFMEKEGVLDNTWIVLTSDHGEMFERGIYGHRQPTFHQPVINIPLMVFSPDQQGRQDVYDFTSNVDILPTLLHVTGHEVHPAIEGKILPLFGDATEDRNIFAQAWSTGGTPKRRQALTAMMVKGNYKLMLYEGWNELGDDSPYHEIYDLAADPDELENLYSPQSSLSKELLDELQRIIEEKDKQAAA